jgi:DNA polymerase zeta
VEIPNKSKTFAFEIGNEIVKLITSRTPTPMKLKFEKVYLPCVLLAKKRYVGFKYEFLEDEDPIFDAKGIETVRRDGCPAVSKILEKSLK